MGLKKRQSEWIFFAACACFSLLFSQLIFSESLDTIAKKMCAASDKLKNKQIAVLPFPYHDGSKGSDSTVISEKLITKIVARKKYQVVERSLLEKVFSELKLQNSGVINQETAKKLGNVLGVEALLTGTLINLGNGHIEINARLINAETGLVLAAADEEIQRTWREEVEPAQAKQSEQDVKDKMSVFFNSSEWKDPRFHPEDGSSKVVAQGQTGIVLSNADEFASSGLGGDEKFIDPPSEWAQPEREEFRGGSSQEFQKIRQAWESLNRKDFDETTKKFSRLRSDLEREPQYAALAQLYLSEGYFKKGKFQEAFREAKQSLKLTKTQRLKAQATYLMARSQEEMGKFGIAAGLYREILQNHPYEDRLIRQSGYRIRAHARKRP